MDKNNGLRAGLPWMAAGAALAALAFVLLSPTARLQAQAPVPQAPLNGTYQISTWSSTDQQGNVFCGFFIMDTRSGMIIDSEYETVANMVNKYKK